MLPSRSIRESLLALLKLLSPVEGKRTRDRDRSHLRGLPVSTKRVWLGRVLTWSIAKLHSSTLL